MAKTDPNPVPQENKNEKYIEIMGKPFTKKGYISFLNNATSELRSEYLKLSAKEAMKMGKTLEQVGLELIKRVVVDKKNLEISEIDVKNEDVNSAKLNMLRVIDSIKHLCLGQKQKERVIEIAPVERVKSPIEIRPARQIEISAQLEARIDGYESIDIPKLKELFDVYFNHPTDTDEDYNERMKLFNDFKDARKECLNRIKSNLSEGEALGNLEITDELYAILKKVDDIGGEEIAMSEAVINRKNVVNEEELPEADIVEDDLDIAV